MNTKGTGHMGEKGRDWKGSGGFKEENVVRVAVEDIGAAGG